jgi:hypothetical protein
LLLLWWLRQIHALSSGPYPNLTLNLALNPIPNLNPNLNLALSRVWLAVADSHTVLEKQLHPTRFAARSFHAVLLTPNFFDVSVTLRSERIREG